jgi:hypothetical protein
MGRLMGEREGGDWGVVSGKSQVPVPAKWDLVELRKGERSLHPPRLQSDLSLEAGDFAQKPPPLSTSQRLAQPLTGDRPLVSRQFGHKSFQGQIESRDWVFFALCNSVQAQWLHQDWGKLWG